MRSEDTPQGRQCGLSLMELIIALGTIGLIAMISTAALKSLFHNTKQSTTLNAQNNLMANIRALGVHATSAVDFSIFTQAGSFAAIGLSPRLPSAIQNGGVIAAFSTRVLGANYNIRRDSSTFDLISVAERTDEVTTAKGANYAPKFIAARCMLESTIRRPLVMSTFLVLDRIPVLRTTASGDPEVVCCTRALDCSNGQVGVGSPWRPRIILAGENMLRVYPVDGDLAHVTGAGFIGLFDQPTNPTVLRFHFFVLDNPCLRSRDSGTNDPTKCASAPDGRNVATTVSNKMIEASIVKRIYDSGIINLGR